MLALIAWSMVHGVAKLAIGSRLPYTSEREVLEFAALAIDTLYRGLALDPRWKPTLAKPEYR